MEQGSAELVRDLLEARPLNATIGVDDVFTGAPQRYALHVLVADPETLERLLTSAPNAAIAHHPIRLKRWRELNERLDACKKATFNENGDGTSTGYSYMRWSVVEDVLQYSRYTQERKEVPTERVAFLFKYLTLVTKMMGECDHAKKEAKCYHFIASMLVCICELLGDDVKILVEERSTAAKCTRMASSSS